MKTAVRLVLVLAFAVSAAPMAAPRRDALPSMAAPERELVKPNYDLASRWTPAKVGKMVFTTAVAPHWLEFSDRFWYNYETPSGMRWWVVDPVKKTKTSLWDNAKVAAQLTRILRTPYDAQHLPITGIKFFDNDTKIRFSVTLPREAKVENAAGEELTGVTQTQDTGGRGAGAAGQAGRGGGRGGTQVQQGGRAGAPGAPAGGAQTKQWWLEYDIATGAVVLNDKYEVERANPTWATVSPDKSIVVFARGHNLFMMDAKNFETAVKKADDPAIEETALTTDGEKFYSYAANGQGGQADQQQIQDDQTTQGGGQGGEGAAARAVSDQDKKFGVRTRAVGLQWAQDNTKFSLTRSDSRKVADLWVINALANPRPTLETYKYGMPGEENQPQEEIHVFNIAAKKEVKVKVDAFKDQQISLETAPVTNLEREKADTGGGRGGGAAGGRGGGVPTRWLASNGDKVYYNRTSRDLKRIDIVEADTVTGESRVIVPERSNTYVEIKPVRLIAGGRQLIHWSERDGWGHFYLYDVATAKPIRQITTGEFVCTGIQSIDEKTRTMLFTAVGREPGEDPYFPHLYKVNIDTGDIKLLDPGNASHAAAVNDKTTFFVDNFSRIDKAPESALYDTLGNKVMDLEKTDTSLLMQAGFKYPEMFTVKADDGITDLDGVMYKPFDFDETRRYPIIEYVYPGPQTESVTRTFNPREQNIALANIGFIVIEIGNRGGSPDRSKWYHNYGYGNLRDYGLADKKVAVEQLAKRYPWIDLNRVGIYGHSGGGFMTAAAMFGFPDFFKVGISESGNHDNSIYNRWWSEKHDGVKEVVKDDKVTFEYDIDKNQDIAKNLKGHLLLITGDIDNNVHPSNTYRVVDALIKADKRFDMMVLPGQRHGYTTDGDYIYWKRVDYFSQWLLGSAPTDVSMLELTRDKELKK